MAGNAASSAISATIASTKGTEPAITSFSVPLVRSDCTTKRLRPTGGVISAISIMMMMTIPNQTGSKPSPNITGATIGIEVIIIESVRSEEHTSELQSLMRNSHAVISLKKNTTDYLQIH